MASGSSCTARGSPSATRSDNQGARVHGRAVEGGVDAGLEAELGHGTLTVKVRANMKRTGKLSTEWSWRYHIIVRCFGES
jgi:hypothetical protein